MDEKYHKELKLVKPELLDFSLLLITPRSIFVEWLNSFQNKKGLGNYRSLRLSEEDSVWLIPQIENFTEPGSYKQFLDDIKPKLLLSELHNFGATPEDFGHPIDKDVFDEYFELALRTSATLITDLF